MDETREFSDTVYKLAERASLQGLGQDEGGVALKLDTGELYTLNDTAFAFLSALDGRKAAGAVVAELAAEYDAQPAEVAADMAGLAAELEAEDLLFRVA